MKRLLCSAGDVILHKFILVPMDKLSDTDEYYREDLGGYFYHWEYTYNTLTKQSDDRMLSHSDFIDNFLPFEVRRVARKLTVWGKTDYYKTEIRFIIVNEEYITSEQRKIIERECGVNR